MLLIVYLFYLSVYYRINIVTVKDWMLIKYMCEEVKDLLLPLHTKIIKRIELKLCIDEVIDLDTLLLIGFFTTENVYKAAMKS